MLVSAQDRLSRVYVYYHNPEQLHCLMHEPALEVLQIYRTGYVDALIKSSDIKLLNSYGFKIKLLIPDVAEYYSKLLDDCTGGIFGNYYLYTEIYQSICSLQSQYPNILKVDSLPTRSVENRALYFIKISNSPNANNGKPEALISGAMHAYEPIGPSVCMSDMMYLCENYATDSEIQWLVNNRQIYFIPVMNPDGYVFNETYPSRMWRKNRRDNGNGSYGVDLNRNYPYKWGYDNNGSSPNPSAWNYRGTAPASEPETQAVMDFVNAHEIRTWQNHHSPGDVLLIPFSYINDYPWEDTLEYFTVCREESVLYGFLDWGNSSQAYGYPCNGELGDWAWCDSITYKVFGFVPELGMDYWEGISDSSLIVDVCQRMLEAELLILKVVGFYPIVLDVAVVDSFPGANNDGILNPGETAVLHATLKNKAIVDTTANVNGLLQTSYPYVTISDSTCTYGDIERLGEKTNYTDPYIVNCSTHANPYDWVFFNMEITWDSGLYEKTLICSLQIGPQTGLAEKEIRVIDNSLVLLPNIYSTRLQLPLDKPCRIYDISGQRVKDYHLTPGIYFLEFDNTVIQKIIIIR